jgi:hypothetical protein
MRTRMTTPDRPWWAAADAPHGRLVGRTRRRVLGVIVAACAVAGTLAGLAVDPGEQTTTGNRGQSISPASVAAVSAGCAGMTRWPEADAAQIGHLPAGATHTWDFYPARSGTFAPVPWTGDVHILPDHSPQPSEAEVVALLYRGWTVAWYRTDGEPGALAGMHLWARNLTPAQQILVAPYPEEQVGGWPTGTTVILVGWNHTQRCIEFSEQVTAQFVAQLPDAPGEGLALDQPGPRAVPAKVVLDVRDPDPRS